MQDLGTLGGNGSSARAVSADGSVVAGDANNAENETRAFRWSNGDTSIIAINRLDTVNEPAHHTNKFRLTEDTSVWRRGQGVRIDVEVRTPFGSENRIEFQAVHTFDGLETTIDVPDYDTEEDIPLDMWGCTELGREADNGSTQIIHMLLYPPFTAPIGEYEAFKCLVRDNDNNILEEVAFDAPVVLLFNSWAENDPVYMDPNLLTKPESYVLEERGRLYQGAWNNISAVDWKFDQFDQDSLTLMMWLIQGQTAAQRSDPAVIARHLAALMNTEDDGGVLKGRWPECPDGLRGQACLDFLKCQYSCDVPNCIKGDCEMPGYWTGSGQIFERYLANGF